MEEYQHQTFGYECPIRNVTGNANEKIQNKNLAWNGWAEDFVSRINDTIKASITTYESRNCLKYRADAGYQEYDTKYMFKINFKENTQYTFSFDCYSGTGNVNLRLIHTDGSQKDISNVTAKKWNKIVFSSNANKTIKYLQVLYAGGTNYIDLDTFMLLEGSYTAETIPEYVPHEEQNYPFTFAQSQRGMQGTELKDDGIHNTRKHYRYTGNETFNKSSYTDSTSFVCFSVFNDLKINANAGYCNVGVVKNIVEVGNYINGFFYHQDQPRGYLKIQKSAIPNWDDNLTDSQQIDLLKTFLSQRYANNNAVEVEYELADSALENNIIPYNETQQAQYNAKKEATSYDDITIISSESDELGFNINVESLGNINTVINNLLNN